MPACRGSARSSRMSRAGPVMVAIGLGTNMGDRAGNLQTAVDGLRRLLSDLRSSRVYETEPMLVRSQPAFLNAVCTGETCLTPRQLMFALQDLELSIGRKPQAVRYGPRIIDLDLLLYGECVIEEPGLEVPHPRMRERGFVLEPLAELSPDWAVPEVDAPGAVTVAELAASVRRSGINLTSIELR